MFTIQAKAELKLDPEAQLYFVDHRPVDGMLEAVLFVPSSNPFRQQVFLIKDNPWTAGIDQYELLADSAECTLIGSDSRLRCVYENDVENELVTVWASTEKDQDHYIVAYSKKNNEPRMTLLELSNATYTENQELISAILGD